MNTETKKNSESQPGSDDQEASGVSESPASCKDEATDESSQNVLKEAEEKAQSYYEQLLRAKAEMENIRRRAVQDVDKAHKYGLERFFKEILLVLDGLESGLEAAEQLKHEETRAVREGVELTHRMLLQTLEKFGMVMINPLGETFNPAQHEALSMQESKDVEPNKVLIVVQKGFLLHDRVLRPARVIVSKPVAPGT